MTVISARGLSKRYSRPIRDSAAPSVLARLIGRDFHEERFWALRDVSFDVSEGDIVGFLGKNGAGKSTLLKILSRIVKPTEGSVTIRGRVGTLLEVGTGFHSEMSGRENTYMNGAILGMSRSEVRRKFDEIVAFAGVEQFIDMPVKRYSSGMYMRLAFAVAAHLDPDILIVDEVLAVGDVQFQRKSLEKVREVSGQGRTVLFVSHNMETVQSLCTKALLLQGGRAGELRDTAAVVHDYVRLVRGSADQPVWTSPSPTGVGDAGARLLRAAVVDGAGETVRGLVEYTDAVWFEVDLEVGATGTDYSVGMALFSEEERLVYESFSHDEGIASLTEGAVRLRVRLPVDLLQPGQYRIRPTLLNRLQEPVLGAPDSEPQVYFDLQGRISRSTRWLHRRPGAIAPRLEWRADKRETLAPAETSPAM